MSFGDERSRTLCIRYIRDWLELPVSACVKETLQLPFNRGGAGLTTFHHLAEKMQLVKRHALRTSQNDDMRQVYTDSSSHHVMSDRLLVSSDSLADATKSLNSEHVTRAANHLYSLQCQGALAKSVHETISKKNITLWSSIIDLLPPPQFIFARKALIQCLPTASNLVRWKRLADPTCSLCSSKVQTNKHVLSNCGSPTALRRYTVRHNDVLLLIVNWLHSALPKTSLLYADLENANCLPVRDLFTTCRPDIAVSNTISISTLELTICHETNLTSSKLYKQSRYQNIANSVTSVATGKMVSNYTIEVSTLGFISDIKNFVKSVDMPDMPHDVKQSIVRSVISSSFQIFCNRNNSSATQ